MVHSKRYLLAALVLACSPGCSGEESNDQPPGQTTTTNTGGSSGAGGTGAGGGLGATGGGGLGGGGGQPTECTQASDCTTLFGAAPCGAWDCPAGLCTALSAGCTDADHDGYGTGASCACAGLDCDDDDDTIGDSVSRACYSGPNGTMGVGTCQAGLEGCTAGVWTPCVGEVVPSGEACNNQDDDCNGQVDDGLGTLSCGIGACAPSSPVQACASGVVGVCVPGVPAATDGPTCNSIDDDCDGIVDEDCALCVPVATNGNDGTADGTTTHPFLTVQAAINWAAANSHTLVCVSAGAACGTQNAPVTGTYANAVATTITMANGVSVAGNYERSNWTRCAGPYTTTVLQPATAEGVTFPVSVTTPTALDGFRVDRFAAATTSAITIVGGTNAFLTAIAVTNTPAVTNSYGINVINGGQVTVSHSRIEAGTGTGESIGMRVVGSSTHVINNCASLDAIGHCDDWCGTNPSFKGRTTQGTGVTYGLLLDHSPGSVIEQSAFCANAADQGAPIRIVGDATNVVIRASLVAAWGGLNDSHGIWLEDCAGAAPWIVDNHYIGAAGTNTSTRVDGIRAIGDCHPVIDSNEQITGGGEGNSSNPNGVYCAKNAQNVTSRCVVLGNKLIQGSQFGFPTIATGVRCDDGGCMRINGNVITGRGGTESYGIWLGATGPMVDNNLIRGGCSPTATGLYAADSWARVQNNRIFGFTAPDCGIGGGGTPQQSIGMHVLTAAGTSELDVHSNDIDGAGSAAACVSRALDLDVLASAPAAGVGIYRNNILRAGVCNTSRYDVRELNVAADPRIFEHNDLDPTGAPTALYFDEAATALATDAAVNALVDMTVSGNISVDPLFVTYPTDLHLQAGSLCIGAGTASGAPTKDMDGGSRDAVTPDIGADEH